MRNWPLELKSQIVEQSFEDGATVADVARQHGLAPSQLSEWRRLARAGKLKFAQGDDVGFASVAVAPFGATETGGAVPPHPIVEPPQTIDLIRGDITIRLPLDTPVLRIAEIASVL